MEIRKAMVPVEDEGLTEMDVIEHQGEPWLVPEWLQNTVEGWMQPARIIRLLGIGGPMGGGMADYFVSNPIPKALIETGQSEGPTRYEVVERPDIRVSTGGVQ